MPALPSNLIAILRKYMPVPIGGVLGAATLDELGIDPLDVPLIVLEIEDAYDVTIGVAEDFETVIELAACLAARLTAKTLPRRPRRRSGWMSTGLERRR